MYFDQLKKEWKKYKNNNLCFWHRLLNFMWKKKYKSFLILAGAIGCLFILLIEDMTASEKMLGLIYFFTAIIIFWYARETYDLKNIQQKELKETRRQFSHRMRPYLRMQWYNKKDGILQIINIGEGTAIDINFDKVIFLEDSRKGFQIKNVSAISAGGNAVLGKRQIEIDAFIRLSDLDMGDMKSFLQDQGKDSKYKIVCFYKNLENKKFRAIFEINNKYNDGFKIIDQKMIR